MVGVIGAARLDLPGAELSNPAAAALLQFTGVRQVGNPVRLRGRGRQCIGLVASMPRRWRVEGFMGANEADPEQPGLIDWHRLQSLQPLFGNPEIRVERVRQQRRSHAPGRC